MTFIQELLKAGFSTLLSLWYLWVLILLVAVTPLLLGLVEQRRLRRAGLPEIDHMSGLEFEKKLQVLFRQLGYRVERTPYVGDYGADLILSRGDERVLVQAKRWTKPVGIKAVQEAAAAKAPYRCQRALVVSNQEFTRSAQELARANQVELWGRRRLATVLLQVQDGGLPAAAPQAPAPATAPLQQQAPNCPRCGRTMVLREGRRGRFWSCTGFPACRGSMDAST